MAVLFALIAAVAYGISDFAAGLMARKASVFLVTVVSQAASSAVVCAALPFTAGTPDGQSVLWGAFAGLGGSSGAMFLYRGLARGTMSIIGPVSALVTAAGSAAVGVALGDCPGLLAAAGVVLACLAVAMVSVSRSTAAVPSSQAWRALLNATAAGIGFTGLFVGLNRAGVSAGLWPVAVASLVGFLVALVAVGIAVLRRYEQLGRLRRVLTGGVVAGVLGGGATVAFAISTHRGMLTVTAVTTSLYPAATVLLALGVLRERMRRVQTLGVGLAVAAVALLSVAHR